MVKAADQVAAALSLDYAAATEEQRRTDLERPLDRYLEPMYKALQLKTAIYEEPDVSEGGDAAAACAVNPCCC